MSIPDNGTDLSHLFGKDDPLNVEYLSPSQVKRLYPKLKTLDITDWKEHGAELTEAITLACDPTNSKYDRLFDELLCTPVQFTELCFQTGMQDMAGGDPNDRIFVTKHNALECRVKRETR